MAASRSKKKVDIRISFVGSGKAATALATRFHELGCTIVEVWSKNADHASKLAKKVDARRVRHLKDLDQDVHYVIIAVKDDAIAETAKKIKMKHAVVVHTSGSVTLSTISKCSRNTGVLYPIQTLINHVNFEDRDVPFAIEGIDMLTEAFFIRPMAEALSDPKFIISTDSETRRNIHLAAVVVSNFPNFLFVKAESFLESKNVPFNILLPLIRKVIGNLETSSPSKNKTGPAVRHDRKTIDHHLQMLESDPELKKIYKTMSDAIQQHDFEKPKRK